MGEGTRAAKAARPLAPVPPGAAVPARGAVPEFLLSAGGRAVLVGAFTALLALARFFAWPAIGAVLLLTALWPQRRRPILIAAALGAVLLVPPLDVGALAVLATAHDAEAWVAWWPLAVAAVIAFGCGYSELVRRFPKSLVGRRPVLFLLALLTAMLIAAAHAPLRGAAWLLTTAGAMALSSYIWFFAYAASDSKLGGVPRPALQIGYWRPFWGFSNVPLGKGAAYLERVEARDAEQLARAQLNGLRLMATATAWWLVLGALREALYVPHPELQARLGDLLPAGGLPSIADLVTRHVEGNDYPLATRWAAVIAGFLASVAHMAAWGNTIVATCRMTGFSAAANTDRPLLATSIADFFNRFYFYFKELLATFFFFPAYLRCFKSRPHLRLFFATLAAAGAGNFLFHFYRDSVEIHRLGYAQALFRYHVYAAYALVLGSAIGLSQLRQQARRARPLTGIARLRATAGVIAFYCLLNVLDTGATTHTILDYASFYGSLLRP